MQQTYVVLIDYKGVLCGYNYEQIYLVQNLFEF